jgi:predicted DNA-binding protein
MRNARKNFHLPLPEALYEQLRGEARRSGRTATAVARTAIEDWLRQARRLEVAEAIGAYAAERAGTAADLDRAFERSGVESWADSEE